MIFKNLPFRVVGVAGAHHCAQFFIGCYGGGLMSFLSGLNLNCCASVSASEVPSIVGMSYCAWPVRHLGNY
jgi:hypothetical protein